MPKTSIIILSGMGLAFFSTGLLFAQEPVSPAAYRLLSTGFEANLGPDQSRTVKIVSEEKVMASFGFSARASTASWSKSKAESVTLAFYLNGKIAGHVVLYGGCQWTDYNIVLGELKPGSHRLKVRYDSELSRSKKDSVRIKGGCTGAYSKGHDLHPVFENSPVVLGRKYPEDLINTYSDTPLVLYHERREDRDGRMTIRYSMVFSHEDGGTDLQGLMARWGRGTDIEWLYSVVLDKSKKSLSRTFQTSGHQVVSFKGRLKGTHPVFQIDGLNNGFSDKGDSPLIFRLNPDHRLTGELSRETVMDAFPETYRVMVEELIREGRIEESANPRTTEVSDPRNYVFVEFSHSSKSELIRHGADGHSWNTSASIAAALRHKRDKTWYASHHGEPGLAISKVGPVRTTIEVPEGTKLDDFDTLSFHMVVPVEPEKAVTIERKPLIILESVSAIMKLEEDFTPVFINIDWKGPISLTQERTTYEIGIPY